MGGRMSLGQVRPKKKKQLHAVTPTPETSTWAQRVTFFSDVECKEEVDDGGRRTCLKRGHAHAKMCIEDLDLPGIPEESEEISRRGDQVHGIVYGF